MIETGTRSEQSLTLIKLSLFKNEKNQTNLCSKTLPQRKSILGIEAEGLVGTAKIENCHQFRQQRNDQVGGSVSSGEENWKTN